MKNKNSVWLLFAFITMLTWGVWGAFSELPAQQGFPSTMVYVVWALSMIPCALVALAINHWKLDHNPKSILLGCLVGFLGAGGQLILFEALKYGPAYIVFPFISMSPIVTVAMSMLLLGERANKVQWIGIVVALAAIFFLSWQDPTDTNVHGYGWILLSTLVFVMWGVQGYFMKFANESMKAESVFFYMALTAVLLAPVAWLMTDFGGEGVVVSWRLASLGFGTQILNAVGALTLVYAYRYGKAIIVSPMQGLAPLITIILSLVIYSKIPGSMLTFGLVLATIALVALSVEPKPKKQ